MDELIDRARRGEASAAELDQIDAWRRASPDNERQYRTTLRLLEAGRALGDIETAVAQPTAAEIVARVAARRRFAGRGVAARFAPWAIAAAAAIVAVVSIRERVATDADAIPGWRSALCRPS